MSAPQDLTIIVRYEPDEGRQVRAILLLLERGLRRGAPDALGNPSESCRPRPGRAKGDTENRRRANDAANKEFTHDVTSIS
jgi:hypothetical protein